MKSQQKLLFLSQNHLRFIHTYQHVQVESQVLHFHYGHFVLLIMIINYYSKHLMSTTVFACQMFYQLKTTQELKDSLFLRIGCCSLIKKLPLAVTNMKTSRLRTKLLCYF